MAYVWSKRNERKGNECKGEEEKENEGKNKKKNQSQFHYKFNN